MEALKLDATCGTEGRYEEDPNWVHSPDHLIWTKKLIDNANNRATWGTTNGVYVFDKPHRTLTLLQKSDTFDKEMHRRIVIAMKMLRQGYRWLKPAGELTRA